MTFLKVLLKVTLHSHFLHIWKSWHAWLSEHKKRFIYFLICFWYTFGFSCITRGLKNTNTNNSNEQVHSLGYEHLLVSAFSALARQSKALLRKRMQSLSYQMLLFCLGCQGQQPLLWRAQHTLQRLTRQFAPSRSLPQAGERERERAYFCDTSLSFQANAEFPLKA